MLCLLWHAVARLVEALRYKPVEALRYKPVEALRYKPVEALRLCRELRAGCIGIV